MNFFIKHLNADAQEATGAEEVSDAAATTNNPVEVAEVKPVKEEVVVTAHDEFDWSVKKRNVAH